MHVLIFIRYYLDLVRFKVHLPIFIKLHPEFFDVKLGVKQGDNLSPILSKFFINDLPEYLENTPNPIFLSDKVVICLMYADDVILLSLTAEALQ